MSDRLHVVALELVAKALDVAQAIADTGAQSFDGWRVEVPDGVDAGCAVFKAMPAKRFTLGLAYPVMKPDVAKAVDGFRDFAQADLIEHAAWDYMANHRQVGLMHFTPDTAAGEVVESYIYRGPDWVMKAVDGSEQRIVAGDWLLGTIWTEPAWQSILDGKANGLSFVGAAARKAPSAESLAALRR